VDEFINILLNCNILCSKLSFTTNMKKKPCSIRGWMRECNKKTTPILVLVDYRSHIAGLAQICQIIFILEKSQFNKSNFDLRYFD
jgi:hypothetical protein